MNKKFLNPPELVNPSEKVCYKCHDKKPIEEFNKCKTGVYGYHNHCKPCQKDIKRAWYLKHREQELLKSSEYSKTPQAKIYRQERWKKVGELIKPVQNARRRTEKAKIKARIQRKKWEQIPQNRIAQSLRSRLRAALKGFIKFKNTESLLGCSYECLKSYLESKFQKGMTWDNYGEWHIDHILPCSLFHLEYEEQQKICFHYTNLQPLWAKDNISKGNKLPN